jgi:hypothetical protein
MHWLLIVLVGIEIVLMLLVTLIERDAIKKRISGANGFIWLSIFGACILTSGIVTLLCWLMISGGFALKVALGAMILHLIMGGSTLYYLDRLGKNSA